MTTRIPHMQPPYESDVAAILENMMPTNSPVEPLKLFRTFTHNPAMAEATRPLGSHFLGRGRSISARDREIVIMRVCARCRCEYEWGVHAVAYGPRVGLSDEQLAATVVGGPDDACWLETDALLVRMVDELHEDAVVGDELWNELSDHWSPEQLLDLLLLAGWYHAISYVANGAHVELEESAARFPEAA